MQYRETQVDFAQDERWKAWNEEALRRFLNTQPANRNEGNPALCQQNVLSPGEPIKGIPESWFRPRQENTNLVTPTIFNRRQEVIETKPIYGAVTQAMALEDDMWNLGMVSYFMQLTLSGLLKNN